MTLAFENRVEIPKKVVFQDINLMQTGEITLPTTSITKNSIKAELLGDPFEWKGLKVETEKKEKMFRP